MFDKNIIHDITMIFLKKNNNQSPVDLAKSYKLAYSQIENELISQKKDLEDEQEEDFSSHFIR